MSLLIIITPKFLINLSPIKKKKSLNIGKNIIQKRISGKNDKTLPYMITNQFSKNLLNYRKLKIKIKKNFYISSLLSR